MFLNKFFGTHFFCARFFPKESGLVGGGLDPYQIVQSPIYIGPKFAKMGVR